MLIPFKSMSSAFPESGLTEETPPPGPPALDIDCGVLERHGESPTLHMRIQLVPYSPSSYQPVKPLLELLYPVSLPAIGIAFWLLHIDVLLEGTVKVGRCNVKLDNIKALIAVIERSAWKFKADNRHQ